MRGYGNPYPKKPVSGIPLAAVLGEAWAMYKELISGENASGSGSIRVNHRWSGAVGRGKLGRVDKSRERVGFALLFAAAAMVPWLFVLSVSLPHTTRVSGWSTAWLGLDVMEGLALLGTGLLLVRRDPRVSPLAAVTASLLLVDAWFDVTTSGSGRELAIAVGMALLVELPICACCVLIAVGAVGIAATSSRGRVRTGRLG